MQSHKTKNSNHVQLSNILTLYTLPSFLYFVEAQSLQEEPTWSQQSIKDPHFCKMLSREHVSTFFAAQLCPQRARDKMAPGSPQESLGEPLCFIACMLGWSFTKRLLTIALQLFRQFFVPQVPSCPSSSLVPPRGGLVQGWESVCFGVVGFP